MGNQATKDEPKADDKAHAKLQREAAERTLASQGEEDKRHKDAHYNSELTTDAHVGKPKEEPHKEQSMEDLKVDKEKDITGGQDVHTAPLETEGKGVTDEVVISPEGAQAGGGAPAPQTHAERAAEAVAEAAPKDEPKHRESKAGGAKKRANR